MRNPITSLRLLNRSRKIPAAGAGKKLRWAIALCCLLTAAHVIAAPQESLSKRSSQFPDFVPGELLVKFRAEVRKEAAADYQAWFDISTRKTFAINGYQHVKLPEGVDIEEALELYLEDPDVEHAEPNYIVYANDNFPDDAEFGKLWGLHNTGQNVNAVNGTSDADIDAPEAWDVTTGSSNVVVAVIDSGVDINHPDLTNNIWVNTDETPGNSTDDDGNGYVDDVNGWDFHAGDNDPRDANGHGTHVAGTVAAEGNNGIGVTGVSQSAKIMPIRFLDAWGSGTTTNAIAAIEYAAANGADIINNSWGGGGYNQALKDAIEASGAVVVCAAGNSGSNTDIFPHYPSSYDSANIISVAASNQDDNRSIFSGSGSSNYGVTSVDVAAPGSNIYSAAPGREIVWQDDFEDNDAGNWAKGGTDNTWATTNEQAYLSTYSLTDSPGANYPDNSDTWVDSPEIDLTGYTAAKLEFKLRGRSELNFDEFSIEASSDNSNWLPVTFQLIGLAGTGSKLSGNVSSWTTAIADLEAYDNEPTVHVRFRLVSDGIVNYDGFYIDDVKITAASSSYSGDEYTFKQGTSMATPHVAGLAALLKAHNPALTVNEIKAAILGSVDVKSPWTSLVATGGRINADAALSAPQISNVQVNSITETTAVITWTTDKPGDSVVQYGTASDSWDSYPNTETDAAMVTSHSITLTGLARQTDYYLMVGSTDVYGNGPDNRIGDINPSAEVTFTTLALDPPSIVEFPVINFAADTITVTYDEPDMQAAGDEDNYSFSPSMNFRTLNPDNDDIADLGGSTYRLSMASIPAYEIFTLTVSNITDIDGSPVAPASIKLNDDDTDSMADDWEADNGLNTAIDDSAGDADGDGFTNLQEYEDRTDPQSAASGQFVIKDTTPKHNAGITSTQRVSNETSFAVLIESVHGIDITDNASIQFTIDDGEPGSPYTLDLGDPAVRAVKLTNDSDDEVTLLWAVYDRTNDPDAAQLFYDWESVVNITVDATDTSANTMAAAAFAFKVESEAANNYANDAQNLPPVGPVGGGLGPNEDGFQVTGGDLTGATVVYDMNEVQTPVFGPMDEIPPVNLSGVMGVAMPMNLQPPTVFDIPVKIYIPCPGYTDVSGLNIYYYNGNSWALASDAAGNVQPGGEGWMVPGSRVDHNGTTPPTIEIQVYHFSGAQAGSFSGGGGGGGGGGCFIAAASHGPLIKHVFSYVLLNLVLISLGTCSIKKIIRKP